MERIDPDGSFQDMLYFLVAAHNERVEAQAAPITLAQPVPCCSCGHSADEHHVGEFTRLEWQPTGISNKVTFRCKRCGCNDYKGPPSAAQPTIADVTEMNEMLFEQNVSLSQEITRVKVQLADTNKAISTVTEDSFALRLAIDAHCRGEVAEEAISTFHAEKLNRNLADTKGLATAPNIPAGMPCIWCNGIGQIKAGTAKIMCPACSGRTTMPDKPADAPPVNPLPFPYLVNPRYTMQKEFAMWAQRKIVFAIAEWLEAEYHEGNIAARLRVFAVERVEEAK